MSHNTAKEGFTVKMSDPTKSTVSGEESMRSNTPEGELMTYLRQLFDKTADALNVSLGYPERVNRALLAVYAYGKRRAPQSEIVPATGTGYIGHVADKCDRITWRNRYYSLPDGVLPCAAGEYTPPSATVPNAATQIRPEREEAVAELGTGKPAAPLVSERDSGGAAAPSAEKQSGTPRTDATIGTDKFVPAWKVRKDMGQLECKLAAAEHDLARAIANHAADLSAQSATVRNEALEEVIEIDEDGIVHPPSVSSTPLNPSPEMIEAGAQRLVRWETGKEQWPDAWSKLDVRAARNDAERCWRSMWLVATMPSAALKRSEDERHNDIGERK